MSNKTKKPNKPETKLICNVIHYRHPCVKCSGLIWTQQALGNSICDDCAFTKGMTVGNDCRGTPNSYNQYHGRNED